jgi:hypothetical protein
VVGLRAKEIHDWTIGEACIQILVVAMTVSSEASTGLDDGPRFIILGDLWVSWSWKILMVNIPLNGLVQWMRIR